MQRLILQELVPEVIWRPAFFPDSERAKHCWDLPLTPLDLLYRLASKSCSSPISHLMDLTSTFLNCKVSPSLGVDEWL